MAILKGEAAKDVIEALDPSTVKYFQQLSPSTSLTLDLGVQVNSNTPYYAADYPVTTSVGEGLNDEQISAIGEIQCVVAQHDGERYPFQYVVADTIVDGKLMPKHISTVMCATGEVLSHKKLSVNR